MDANRHCDEKGRSPLTAFRSTHLPSTDQCSWASPGDPCIPDAPVRSSNPRQSEHQVRRPLTRFGRIGSELSPNEIKGWSIEHSHIAVASASCGKRGLPQASTSERGPIVQPGICGEELNGLRMNAASPERPPRCGS